MERLIARLNETCRDTEADWIPENIVVADDGSVSVADDCGCIVKEDKVEVCDACQGVLNEYNKRGIIVEYNEKRVIQSLQDRITTLEHRMMAMEQKVRSIHK